MNNEYNQYTKCMFYLYNEDNKEVGKFKEYIDIKRNYGAIACTSEIASIASDISNENFAELKKDIPLKKLVKDIKFTFETEGNQIVCKYTYIMNKDKSLTRNEIYKINAYIENNMNRNFKVHNYFINKTKEKFFVYIDFSGKLKFKED